MPAFNFHVFISATLGAGVEFLEIVAIAYALGKSGYAKEAIWGTITGLGTISLCAMVLGPGLSLIPLHPVQIIAGTVLLYFGWKWVRKSMLRQATGKRSGWISDPLRGLQLESADSHLKFDYGTFVVMFKSSALETFEVALIVSTMALGAKAWPEPILGAFAALFITIGTVVLLHGRLRKVPDVILKLGAGILLLAFGTFWLGEGVGIAWPLDDLSLLILFLLYAGGAFVGIQLLRKRDTIKSG
jgi:uncharacterized membrane protein